MRGVLSRAAHDVVHGLGTLPSGPAAAVRPSFGEACLLGSSCFLGPVAGLVSVAAPLELCRTMASDMVDCIDCPQEAERIAESVLGELANMIASRVACSLEPAEAVRMTPPTVERSTYDDWITMDGARDTVRLNVGGWPLLAMLSLRAA